MRLRQPWFLPVFVIWWNLIWVSYIIILIRNVYGVDCRIVCDIWWIHGFFIIWQYRNKTLMTTNFIEYLFNFCGINLSYVSYHIRCNPAIAQQLPLEHIKWQTYTGIYIYQRLREMLFLFSFTFSYHNQLKFGRCDILHIHYNVIYDTRHVCVK